MFRKIYDWIFPVAYQYYLITEEVYPGKQLTLRVRFDPVERYVVKKIEKPYRYFRFYKKWRFPGDRLL